MTAALAVDLGWTGVDDVFSGPDNFVAAYDPKGDPAKMIDGLGERYEVTETTSSDGPRAAPIQSPLDALQLILKKHPFEPDQVKQVVVRTATSAAYTVNNREMPDICLQHMVAVMIIDKTASFKAAHDKPRMQDRAVLTRARQSAAHRRRRARKARSPSAWPSSKSRWTTEPS